MTLKSLNKYDLIIFDCDGTLVDTEHMNCHALSLCLIEAGFTQYTPEIIVSTFSAIKVSQIFEMIEDETGRKIPENLTERFMAKLGEMRQQHQRHIPHVEEFIELCVAQGKDICVASNGEISAVVDSLQVADLIKHFDQEHVFNAVMVPQPKPAPDLFLHACKVMGHAAEKALVFEDSVPGVKAAKAAQIDCIGFYGTYPDKNIHSEKLLNAGAFAVYDQFIHILEDLQSTKMLCHEGTM